MPNEEEDENSLSLTPYEVYIKLLQHRFGSVVDAKATGEIGAYLPQEYLKLEYQIDAVKQCFAALHNRGGFMLPVVADDLNAAITAAFAAQVQNYEEHKGKPRIVTGFLK